MNEIIADISIKLSELLNIPEVDMCNAVMIALADYNIIPKTNELIVVQESNEAKALKMFFIAKHTEGLTDRSLNYYKNILSHIFGRINKPYLSISSDDIRMYLAGRSLADKISKTTLNNERRVLSSFYSWLTAEEYITKNPMLRIGNIKEDKRIKQSFTEEDVERLRSSATNLRDKAIIEFLYSTGVRVSELIGLNRRDIDFINSQCIVFGKGNKERYVFLNVKSKLALKEYLDSRSDDNEALFTSSNRKRLTSGAVESIVRDIGKKIGIDKVHPHRFRRTSATIALNRGMPIEEVQKMLGHAKIETTTLYAQSDLQNIKSSHRKFLT